MMKMKLHSLLLLLFQVLDLIPPSCSDDNATFSYVVSVSAVDPVYGVRLDSSVPAVELALDHVNTNPTLLPGVNLTYGGVRTLQCEEEYQVSDSDVGYGILGSSCVEGPSQQTQEVAQIVFTPSSGEHFNSCSVGFPAIYKIHPTSITYASAAVAFIQQSRWQRFAVLNRGGMFFDKVMEDLVEILANSSISIIEAEQNNTELFPDDVRIFFLNLDIANTVQVMCEAYNAGKLFPSYIWIAYSRDYSTTLGGSSCSEGDLANFLDGVFTIMPSVAEMDDESLRTVKEAMITDEGFTPLSCFAFDAVWVLASAMNASAMNTTCPINNTLPQNLSVNGTTGEITFDEDGNRQLNVLGLGQFRNVSAGYLPQEVLVARISVCLVTGTDFRFVEGENETTIFRGPVPADGTPIKMISVIPLPIVVIYYIIATMGIVFTLACLIFTTVYRKKKIVKLTSPNLNYFIIVGAVLLYSSVYFRFLPNSSFSYHRFLCSYQIFATDLGYVLGFAPVLLKMWRVYYIFHKPRPGKKVVKDWLLVVGVVVLVGIITGIMIIEELVPPFRPIPELVTDQERPTGRTDDGITINFCEYECYNGRVLPLLLTGLGFSYLVLLQVIAFVLAVVTRNVKIKVLNDSKEMAIIIYTTSVVLLVLGIVTFGLSSYLIVTETLFNGGVILATTVVVFFLFVPKMVLLYRDPEGQNIFKKQKGSSVSNPQQMTIRPTEMALPSTLGQSVSGSHNYNLLSGSTAVNTSHVQSVNQATSSSSE